MKKIEISLQRKIAAVAISIALAAVTYFLITCICREWLHVSSDFLRIFISLVIAIPVGAVSCKALIESWTGEKIE